MRNDEVHVKRISCRSSTLHREHVHGGKRAPSALLIRGVMNEHEGPDQPYQKALALVTQWAPLDVR